MKAALAVLHVAIVALAVFCFDGLLLKFHRPYASLVPYALVSMALLGAVARAVAARIPPEQRNKAERAWCSLDWTAGVWAAFLLVLLISFHEGFTRAGGDGREYFAQLHSVVIDRDFDFANEGRDFGATHAADFPFGSAVLWLPFYLAAHVWIGLINLFGDGFRHDGYFYPYQMAIGLGTLAYGFAGLVLIYKMACDYFPRGVSLASTLAIALGSFVVWYLTVDNSYTHGNSLFAVTLFLYVWHRTRSSRSLWQWMLLGLCGGLMVMVRWQSAFFLAPLAFDVLASAWRSISIRDRNMLVRTAREAVAGAAGVLVGFAPQMIFWKAAHGGFLAVPHYQAGQQWWRDPLMADVLFSSNHGLFSWHPILYLAFLGTPLLLKRDWRLGWLLVGLFVAQIYTNSAVATWWGGSAFGGRRFDGCVLLFVLGLAALIQWSRDRPAVLWTGILGTFIVVNTGFMREVTAGRLPMGEGISADRLFNSLLGRFGNPFSFPANVWFAWRHGTTPGLYDRLGEALLTNLRLDIGEDDDDRFLMHGWSGRERDRAGGSFRWVEGRQSSIAVPLQGPRYIEVGEPQQLDDYVLRLRAEPYVSRDGQRQIVRITVNGRYLTEQEFGPGFHEYEIDVPHEFLKRSINVIAFEFAYARSPGASDRRELSARFDYIHLIVRPRNDEP